MHKSLLCGMDYQVNNALGNASGIKELSNTTTCYSVICANDRDSEICSYAIESEETTQEDIVQWYVLRFLYRNQPKVRIQFESDGIETFSPMRWVSRVENGKYTLKYDYAIWDLFFVHSSKKIIDPYVNRFENLQYKFQSGGKPHNPMVIPDKQMNDFVAVVKSSKKPLYFAPNEINLSKGERIRLIGGRLNGYEGFLVKVNGSRQRRLVVELPGTLCAAVEVEPEYIEIIR